MHQLTLSAPSARRASAKSRTVKKSRSLAELHPRPTAVLLLRRVAPVQGMVGRLHVVAEVLIALAERVDVVAGDVAGQQEQRCQRHKRGFSGLVGSL